MPKVTTDFHLHSDISADAHSPFDKMVQAALRRGLEEIAMTDHLDLNPADEGCGRFDPQQVYQLCRKVREAYPQITIRLGVELSEAHLYKDRLAQLYALPLDLVIGSIHYIGSHGVHADLFDVCPAEEGIGLYFEQMLAMVREADFDVLGHLDYFQRYTRRRGFADYDLGRFGGTIRQILQELMRRDIALEINSSGLRSVAKTVFPRQEVIEWYYRMGGRKICLGSDAHRAEHVGVGLDEAIQLLREIGFDRHVVYRSRRAHWLELPS